MKCTFYNNSSGSAFNIHKWDALTKEISFIHWEKCQRLLLAWQYSISMIIGVKSFIMYDPSAYGLLQWQRHTVTTKAVCSHHTKAISILLCLKEESKYIFILLKRYLFGIDSEYIRLGTVPCGSSLFYSNVDQYRRSRHNEKDTIHEVRYLELGNTKE